MLEKVKRLAKPYRARRWRHALPDPAACLLLAKTLGLSHVTAQVLYNRGLTTPEAAHAFLTAGREQIIDPFRLKDMDKAVALIRQQIAAGRPIMVYGDYDVDGVTGTTILVLALRALGATVEYYIPNRFSEGYGLNVGALEEIAARGFDFVLSVDTGVSANKEAEAAKAMGMTLVVSDHHEPGPVLPDVPALINPKRPDCTYPFKGLSGVGVAFKLAVALEAPNAWDLLDIVTLGTIADMVPLVGENRAIVREGLAMLGATRRPGLKALMEVAGVKQPVTATHIGFSLGPRINALGRMDSAMEGVELLVTEDPARAQELARYLDERNRDRQETEQAILAEAMQQAEAQSPGEKEHVLVLAGEGWHHGVVGICASRVLDAFYRPAILLSVEGEKARGSARSIPAFHMHRALLQVSDLFAKFGGHAAAAGMTLKSKDDVPVLRRRLNELGARWLKPEDLVPELRIDATLTLDQITDELMAELQKLEPHGIGNPGPLFAVEDVRVMDARTMGKEQQHLKLLLRGQGPLMEAVGWGLAPAKPAPTARVQVAFQPEYNTYMGRRSLQLTMKDVQVIASPEDSGMPVNVAAVTRVTAEQCEAWEPLAGLVEAGRPGRRPALAVDARGAQLGRRLDELNAPHEEVAVAADESEHDEKPEPTRLLYLEALTLMPGQRLLVRTASPWAAAGLMADLQVAMPDRRDALRLWLPGQPEPQDGALVVAPYGLEARGSYTDTLLYHPPYHEGQIPGGRVHLLWEPGDWALAEAALGWPYPDRDVLVECYKLLKKGETQPEALAQALGEAPGPWNRARWQAALTIFQELGLVNGRDGLNGHGGVKFQLEASARYRRGLAGREALRALQASDWPDAT